jgi:hypothetical protein
VKTRIERFVDWFIRSEYVQNWTSEKDGDFINETDRAGRCWDAAENGSDGKTHAEVIEDWRESFQAWIRDKRNHPSGNPLDRFESAINAHFDSVEGWHDKNGSLSQQIG